ncbi:MAG: rubrerythrin family protein [bacterium]|nr:rubrerythrin family protein [bacterium]
MSQTEQNLKASFAGESQANRKYLAFADKAQREGYPAVAKLFRTIAEAETIHAMSELRALGHVKTTAENLQAAIEGETYEYTEMYPAFLTAARTEGHGAAQRAFEYALEAEKVHAAIYKEMLAGLDAKEDAEFYLCPTCGYIHKNAAPETCPICGAKGVAFKKVA